MKIVKVLLGTIVVGTIVVVLKKILKKDVPTGWRYTTDFDSYDEDVTDEFNGGGEEEVLGI